MYVGNVTYVVLSVENVMSYVVKASVVFEGVQLFKSEIICNNGNSRNYLILP